MKTEVLQNPQTKTRTVYLDYLRVLATFAVIVIHTCAECWRTGEALSYNWNILTIYESLVRWCVPIFVMISGALFLNPQKETGLKQLFTKNIFRLISSFLFWSFCHSLIDHRKNLLTPSVLFQTVEGYFHLWFVPMIAGVYLLIPFLKEIIKKEKLTKYFLLLFAVFAVIIPQTFTFIFDCIGIDTISSLVSPFKKVINYLNVNFVSGYVGVFILGYFVNNIKLSQKQRTIIYIGGAIGFITTFIGTVFVSTRLSKPAGYFFDYLTINVMLESVAVFVFFKHLFEKIKISERINSFVAKLSKYSFGIYLCHILVLKVTAKIGLTAVSFNPIFAVPVTALFVFTVSCIISAIIHKIPILKKYIV